MTTPHDQSLSTDVRVNGSDSSVQVRGEIDLTNAHELRLVLIERLVAGATHLSVDLQGVTFIDAIGLGALVAVRREATMRHARLVLVRPHRRVVAVLRLAGLDGVFHVLAEAPVPVAHAG